MLVKVGLTIDKKVLTPSAESYSMSMTIQLTFMVNILHTAAFCNSFYLPPQVGVVRTSEV